MGNHCGARIARAENGEGMFKRTTLVAALAACTAFAGTAAASPYPEPGTSNCHGHVMAISNHSSGAYGASGNPKSSAGAGYFLGSSTHAEVVPYVAEYCASGS
jgi:hypothetical protein